MKICRYKNPHLKGLPPRLGVIYNGQIIDPHLNFVAEYEREGLFNPWERAEVKCPSLSVQLSTASLHSAGDQQAEPQMRQCVGLQNVPEGLWLKR